MAADYDTPYHSLMLLQCRYVALWDVLFNYLGHDSSALPLLQGLNDDFDRLIDELVEKGVL